MNRPFEWTKEQQAQLVVGARCTYWSGMMPHPGVVTAAHGDGTYDICHTNSFHQGRGIRIPTMAIEPDSVRGPIPAADEVVATFRGLERSWRGRADRENAADELAEICARFESLL